MRMEISRSVTGEILENIQEISLSAKYYSMFRAGDISVKSLQFKPE